MFERYSFVAITTADLARARDFWVDRMGFAISQEEVGEFFIVDAGGLRLCVDVADGDVHRTGSTDPIIGLKVRSLADALAALEERGVAADEGPIMGARGSHATLRDPDGRAVIVTEVD